MPDVTLIDVTEHNYKTVVELCVSPEQERWVGTTAEAIADAHFHPTYVMQAVVSRNEGNKIVGLLMYERFGSWQSHDQRITLLRFLIDCKYQQRGYGRAALERWFRDRNEPHGGLRRDQVTVHVQPDNTAAIAFYRSLGFEVHLIGSH